MILVLINENRQNMKTLNYFFTYYLMFTKPNIYGKAWKVSHKKRPLAILCIIAYELKKQNFN